MSAAQLIHEIRAELQRLESPSYQAEQGVVADGKVLGMLRRLTGRLATDDNACADFGRIVADIASPRAHLSQLSDSLLAKG